MFIGLLSESGGLTVNNWAGCIALLALGIILIVKGGDWFVDAASWMAEVSGIPTFIIGATIVSLATTLPEILVSSLAAAEGSVGLAIGNAVGSVNCNIGLIMAVSLLFIPSKFERKDYAAKMTLLLVAISVLWAVSATADKVVTWWEGLIVLAIFIAFMVENLLSAKKHAAQLEIESPVTSPDIVTAAQSEQGEGDIVTGPFDDVWAQQERKSAPLYYFEEAKKRKLITIKRTGKVIEKKDIFKNIVLFIVGAGFIVLGAQQLCDNGSQMAAMAGVSQDIIGVTILAVGTSLPELVTTITSIIKKKADLSVGNIIGANIIDISLILPLCAIISSAKFGAALPISPQSAVLDFPFCLMVAAMAMLPALVMGRFKRWQGGILLLMYVAYITLLVLNTAQIIFIY